MSVRVKICGITNLDDAAAAIEAGADALGFVFCETSPRCLSLPTAARIIQELPPFVSKVGVFVNAPEAMIRTVLQQCGIDTVQLHGDESPEFCRRFGCKVIRAFRVRDEHTLERAVEYKGHAWLLDSFVPGQTGGTGKVFNWDLARRAVALCPGVILAGGLTPANVAEAVRQVRPYAVDVSSGVESKPGKKDHQRVRDFIRAAKSAEEGQTE
jgi:phosphoribosylanthranilate isomerase